MNISTEQSKTEFHYSGVRYSELVKNVFVLLWSVIVSCAFIGNALHCVVISGSLEELAGGTLGVLILFMGTPHFLQLLYVQLVLAFYLRERATKEKSQLQKRTETTISALLKLKSWIIVLQNLEINALPRGDCLRAYDVETVILVANNDLIKCRGVMWKKRVDLKELFFYLRTQSEKRSSVRFVTFVGYAEFPMNLVLNILKLHLRIT